MGVEEWASIGAALGVVPGLQWLWRRLARNPKAEAEARKLNVQADDMIVIRLWAEIERLDHDLKEVRAELVTVRTTAADEKTHLETENKQLRTEVGRLRARVEDLEAILKLPTTPEDMRRQLEELNRKGGAK